MIVFKHPLRYAGPIVIGGILLFLGLGACAHSQPAETSQMSAPDSRKKLSDALKGRPTIPRPEEPLAPGMIRTSVQVLGYEAGERTSRCTLKILQIHGYGPSTPPLAVGTQLQAGIRRTLVESTQRAGAPEGKGFESGQVLEITLVHQTMMSQSKSKSPAWRILQLH